MRRGPLFAVVVLGLACGRSQPGTPAPGETFEKRVSFSILEDYDKGEDLTEVARDFELMRRLGVRTWRGSFGWDDYEPERGRLDLDWLHSFAELAARHGIILRPYLGYTAEWAAVGRTEDEQVWNDPPARLQDWASFVSRFATALKQHPNIASYEIYNEENVSLWWDGTAEEFATVFEVGARAVHEAAPGVGVLPGGMVWPDGEWLEEVCRREPVGGMAAAAFHAYPETWTPDSVVVETYLDAVYQESFLPAVDRCGAPPVWINEMGYATIPGRTELQQADWWVRAVATFLASPRVEHIGIYEIKDLRPDSPVIGDAPNYHLGLTYVDRRPKLAFRTVDLLTDLLDTGTLTVADAELEVKVVGGSAGNLHHHLFVRPDGDQILFVWDRTAAPTLDLTVRRSAAKATTYSLAGTPTPTPLEHGRTLRSVSLSPGTTRIFRLHPR